MSDQPYTGLGPSRTPLTIEHVMRGIGRIYTRSRVLRTTDGLGGDAAFYAGASIVHAQANVELYLTSNVQDWVKEYAAKLDPTIDQMPPAYRNRAYACIHSVLGVDGQSPTGELILWLDPEHSGPQYWAVLAAQTAGVTVYNLADFETLGIWKAWVSDHTPKVSAVESQD